MKSPIKRKVLFPLVALAALGGGAAAVAATSASHPASAKQAYIESVARHLGVPSSKVTAAMQAAAVERVQAAVAAGRVTKAEGEKIEHRIQEGRGPILGGGFDGSGYAGVRMSVMRAAATYLGVSPKTLRAERRAGKTLEQIAAATPGKSAEGLKAALLADAKQRLATALTRGIVTPQQALRITERLPARIDALITRTPALKAAHGGPAPGA
jgi:hypothetical protein